MEKRYLAMWMWLCEGKLKVKTAHFRLPSASQKRACLSSRIFTTFTCERPNRLLKALSRRVWEFGLFPKKTCLEFFYFEILFSRRITPNSWYQTISRIFMVEYSRPLTVSVRIIFWKQQVEGSFGRSRPPPPQKKKKTNVSASFLFRDFFLLGSPHIFLSYFVNVL